jgi:hypothetical protein
MEAVETLSCFGNQLFFTSSSATASCCRTDRPNKKRTLSEVESDSEPRNYPKAEIESDSFF